MSKNAIILGRERLCILNSPQNIECFELPIIFIVICILIGKLLLNSRSKMVLLMLFSSTFRILALIPPNLPPISYVGSTCLVEWHTSTPKGPKILELFSKS